MVKPAPQINKQRRTENNVCVPILSNKSPLSLIVLKSEYHCHTFHISAEKAVLGFFFFNSLCCRVNYLFIILPLFCTNFNKKPTISELWKKSKKNLGKVL